MNLQFVYLYVNPPVTTFEWLELGACIMAPESISTANIVFPFHQ